MHFLGWQIASGTVFVISATRPRPERFPSRTMSLRARGSSPCCATNARAQKNVWRQGRFIRNDPGRTQGSKQKCMSTRNTEDPTRSGEFRQGSDFQIVQLLCIEGSLFSQFSRLPNDLRTTSERPLNDIGISVRMTTCPQKPTDRRPFIPCALHSKSLTW